MVSEPLPAYVEVRVADLLWVTPKIEGSEGRSIVILKSLDDTQTLHIWVGGFERDSLTITLSAVATERPLTFRFTASLLAAAGAKLAEVRISRLVEDTFFAETVLQTASGETQVVDSRPSDAMTLALTAGVPIKVAAEVFEQVGPLGTRSALADLSTARHLPEIAQHLKQRNERTREEFKAELAARKLSSSQPSDPS